MSYNATPYRGDQYLFQGISQAGSSIGAGVSQGLNRMMDERALKKFIDALKAAREKMIGMPNNILPGGGMIQDEGPGGPLDPGAPIADEGPGGPMVPQYQEGGFTGFGDPSQPAGTVHRGEYVVPQPDVEAAGGPDGIAAMLGALRDNPRAASAQGFGAITHLVESMDRRREAEKNVSATGKALKTIFKANPDLSKLAGVLPEQIDNLGNREVMQLFEGVSHAQAMKNVAEQIKAHLADSQARSAQAQGVAQTEADFSGYVKDLPGARQYAPTAPDLSGYYEADANEMPARPVKPMAQAMPELAARYPRAPLHPNFDNYAKALESGQGPDWEGVKPREGVTKGGRGYLYGKSGQFQIMPQEFGDGVQQIPVLDENGQPTGEFMLPDGRGGVRRAPKGTQRPPPTKLVEELVEPGKEYRMAAEALKNAKDEASKGRAQRRLNEAQANAKYAIDLYHGYGQIADEQRARMYGDFGIAGVGPAAKAAGSGAVQTSGPLMPKNQKEFDAVPKGALYVNPADGKTYKKK